LFDNISALDKRTRYAGGKIDPKHTFIGQHIGGIFGMKKVPRTYAPCFGTPQIIFESLMSCIFRSLGTKHFPFVN
jgi:hypothetical protein